jgi:hypothetical protein
MDSQILGWANMAMDAVEVAAVVAVVLVLLRLRRDIGALLRVVRRMDRKTASPTTTPYRRQAELNEPPSELTGNRQSELDRMVAD